MAAGMPIGVHDEAKAVSVRNSVLLEAPRRDRGGRFGFPLAAN